MQKDFEPNINKETQANQTVFYAFGIHPVSLRGFELFELRDVELGSQKKLQALAPEMQELQGYNPDSAIVISENQEPILAIINGTSTYTTHPTDGHGHSHEKINTSTNNLSLVSLFNHPEQIIVQGQRTQPLDNNYHPSWPGYAYYNHVNKFKPGLETLVVEKQSDGQFNIFFVNQHNQKV